MILNNKNFTHPIGKKLIKVISKSTINEKRDFVKHHLGTAGVFSIVIARALLSTLFTKHLFEGIEVLHLSGSEKQLFKLFHIVNTL